ncbi:cytochrome P450 [Lentinula raphanica]|nr:cytochrome P450 [Lentinula raphanica]
MHDISLFCSLSVLFILVYIKHRELSSPQAKHPPGPKPVFLIGNALQIPTASPQFTFTKWLEEYGDMVYLRVFQQPMLVLNSLESARDLLHNRSSIYSDRPNFILLRLMGWENASPQVRYGPQFRRHRRFIQQTFNQSAIEELRPIQEKQISYLLQDIVGSPAQIDDHLRRFSAGIIMKVTYGADVKSINDPLVQIAHHAELLTIESGTPSATLVDYIPALKYIPVWAPLAGFKRNAALVKEAVDTMFNVPYEMVKSQMTSGIASSCMTSRLIAACSPAGVTFLSPEDEEDIKAVAGTMHSASDDTTRCVLSTFILAMVLHPQVFERAQAEMDRVIDLDRLPNLEDRDSLPYLECVLKEACRWNVPIPLGMPHRLVDDDIYRDYHIPKGTTVMANIHAILQNCSQPQLFRPERYMEDSHLPDPRDVIFGFGRRRCPGRHFADRNVWLVAASLVSATIIGKAEDDAGNEITPEAKFLDGFVRHPASFPYSIKFRPEKISALNNWNAALDV